MTQKRLIISAVLLKGFTSITIQTLLIRELLIIFFGNELTFAVILTTWLLSSAFGSSIIANFFKKTKEPVRLYCFFQLILSVSIPAVLVFIRCSRTVLHIPFGEIFSLWQIITVTVIGLGAVAVLDGSMFTIAFRLVTSITNKESSPMAKTYLLESLGLIIGGIIFTFIMLSLFNAFEIAFLLSGANLFISLLLLKNNAGVIKKIIFLLAFLASTACFFLSDQIQQQTLNIQWYKKNIVAYNNSVFGNIVAAKENKQYTIFYDGLPAVTLPAGDIFFTEDFIHIPMLLNPKAHSILFIGHAAGGLIQEALKYKGKKITYCEIDPVFIQTLLGLEIQKVKNELADPRVHIQYTDARSYIKTTPFKYDMIFINVDLPTSLAINRYYTKEFFEGVRQHLNPEGLAVFKTWGSLAYLSDEFKTMNAVVYKTMRSAFNNLTCIPGDGFNLFLASNKKPDIDIQTMMRHYHGFGITTSLINREYLNLRLDPAYQQWFFENIEPELEKTTINRDLKPSGLKAALMLYYAQFSRQIPILFRALKNIKLFHLSFILLSFCVLLACLRQNKSGLLKITVFSSGFFAMSTQVTTLFLFQSLLGILFQWLAVLTASFMAGISAGTFILNKRLKLFVSLKTLGLIECLLPVSITLLALCIAMLFNNNYHPGILKGLFCLLSFSAGGLIGLEIPSVFALITASLPQNQPSHVSAGHLYGLDLAGACIGALVTPLILIPNCGIITTLLLMCLLKLINGINLLLLKHEM